MLKAKIVKASEEAAHYDEGRDWESDKVHRAQVSEKRAWKVAFSAVGLALLMGIGIVVVAHVPRGVPFVYERDKSSGDVSLLTAMADEKTTSFQELRDKNYAQRYVIARESYLYQLLQKNYDDVLRWSSDDVGQAYAKLYEGDNARDKKYGANVVMDVTPVSVQLVPDDVGVKAVVRFSKKTHRVEAENTDPPQYFVATIAYEYKPSMFGKEKDLIANPDGYKVTGYRVDAELSAMPAPAAAAAGVAPAPAAVPAIRLGH